MPGLWLEEFFEGQVFDHPIRRTITESDNVLFCGMTMNPAARLRSGVCPAQITTVSTGSSCGAPFTVTSSPSDVIAS